MQAQLPRKADHRDTEARRSGATGECRSTKVEVREYKGFSRQAFGALCALGGMFWVRSIRCRSLARTSKPRNSYFPLRHSHILSVASVSLWSAFWFWANSHGRFDVTLSSVANEHQRSQKELS
jgi:hypothetical protein